MKTRLNHRQLEAFRAVIVTGAVTQAAEMLHVTQPAVTRLISDLEHAVGMALFERRKGRLVATVEGRLFYEEVDKSFIGLGKIAQVAEEIRHFKRGTLLITGMPAMSLGFLPRIIRRFLDAYPEIGVSLQVRSSEKVLEWIATQQFDVGFAATQATHPAVETERLLDASLVCMVPSGHPLEKNAVVRPADLEDESFITLGPELSIRLYIDAVFEDAKVRRRRTIEAQLSATACALVLEGAGLALVDPVAAADFVDRGISAKRFEPSIPFVYSVVYPKYRPRSRLTREFVALVREGLRNTPLLQE